jgi:hypothetical protein
MAWIRSQDQQNLVNWDYFYVDESNLRAAQRGDESAAIIGVFPTQEAAIKELDCIERWISTGTPDVYQVGKP